MECRDGESNEESKEEELVYLSEQILGAYYDEFAYKIGIKNNGILSIIASLGMYLEANSIFCKD